MKSKKYLMNILLLSLVLAASLNANTYYVATNGSDSNDGLSESTAWATIRYAGTQVAQGDTLYIKAGTYNGERISFANSGTSENPIVIVGYKTNPGDIDNIDWWSYGTELDPYKMPLLNGGDRASGTAFQIHSMEYVEIKNIQVAKYLEAFSIYSNNIHLENIIATTFGRESSNSSTYSGKGININGDSNTAEDCVVLNAGAEGINMVGSNNVLDNCKVYCDEGYIAQPNVNVATDYYIVLYGDNNIVKGCYIERVGDLEHGGAGIGIKGAGNNNVFENCTAKNLRNSGFYVRHRGVSNNTFNNCTVLGGINGDGFIVRDGAHHNTFNYCRTDSAVLAVGFYDTDEDGINNAGMYNSFNNCIFENTQHSIIAFAGQNRNSKAEYNNFVNCVFYNGENLFNTGRTNENNKMINCIVSCIKEYKYTKYTNYREVHFKFEHTTFWDNGFSVPFNDKSTYENILQVNPHFVDAENGDYHLEYNSRCIDAGQADMSTYNLPELDYYGNPRFFDSKLNGNAIVDMGIHEFQTVTDMDDKNSTTPKEFVLFDNYPNPFNPSTTIAYELSKTSDVRVTIYNMLGQKITTLVNSNQKAGTHSVVWNAANVASGLYLYKVKAGKSLAIKKCLLLK